MSQGAGLEAYTVRVCNDSQLDANHTLAETIWASGPLWREYYERLQDTPYNREGRLQGFTLVRRGQEEGEGFAFAHTFRTSAWLKEDGHIRSINVYWLCFLMTPPEHRGKGFASRLCQTLHHIMAPHTPWPREFGAPPIIPHEFRFYPGFASCLTTSNTELFERCPVGTTAPDSVGWMPAGVNANGDVSFFLEKMPARVISDYRDRSTYPASDEQRDFTLHKEKWVWTWVFQSDYEDLQPGLTKAMLGDLEHASVKENPRVLHQRPDTNGILQHFDLRTAMVIGSRTPTPASFPAGVRFFKSGSETGNLDIHSEMQPVDPLILFVPGVIDPQTLYLSLTINIKQNIPSGIMSAIYDSLQAFSHIWPTTLSSVQLWGHGQDDPLVRRLEEECSAAWSSRNEGGIKNCVVWYGDPLKDESEKDLSETILEGLEFWAMG